MLHTMTVEARHLPQATARGTVHLRAIEGLLLAHPGEPDSGLGPVVEYARVTPTEDPETQQVQLELWHGAAWMFGIQLMLDDQVTIQVESYDDLDFPTPPSRDGLVRVHGTWKRRGEVSWAPEGYPAR